MRGPFDPTKNMDNQPTWAIWEYEIATDTLHRLIAADITAAAGQDMSPYYLPDGRVIFSSTRQRQAKAILLDEGKPQFDAQDEDRRQTTYVLHVMDADGSNLHQVSFNQSDDFDPTVLDSGKDPVQPLESRGRTSTASISIDESGRQRLAARCTAAQPPDRHEQQRGRSSSARMK